MYMAANSGGTIPSIVALGNNGTAAGVYLFNAANSILRLNGHTLQVSGTRILLSKTWPIPLTPWDSMPACQFRIKLYRDRRSDIYIGNQVFSSVPTYPDLTISNTNNVTGADIYL